jgi:ribonucleoside-triphosphate reductase
MGNKSVISRVRKRDGRIVLFDQDRITNAIFKAAQAVDGTDKELAKKLSYQVVRILEERFGIDIIPTVEQIQDLVEKILIENGHAKTSKAFILYREQRRKLREMAVLTEPIGIVEGYIRQNDWKVNENSNMTYSLQGLNSHISNAIISKYWLEKLYTPRIREAYEKGDIHIHDLGTLGCYCVGWDLKDLLLSGFKGVSGKVESKPPKHFRTALGQAVNFFYTLQGEAAGAMAFSNFDTLLAPFIAYDKLTSAEIKQALQEFIFNMNVPTRVGFQTPFSNITLDLKVPDFMKEEHVLIGGKIMDKKYKHFQREMDLFNEILAEVILEGDASGRVFTFPIPTYNITKDFDWDNHTYDNIWEMTAKYGVPYFSNFINSDMKPDDARSMCCRLRLDQRELRKRGGGLFGSNPLTGSIGVVTINMARIGYLAKTEEEFFERLSNLMNISKESLEVKRKALEDFTEQNLYPYSKFYLRNMKVSTGLYWKNHFSTIGLLGMNEALLNFMQKDIASEEGRNFAIKTLDFMRKKISEYQQEIGNIYNLEATPGESTTYRFAKKDKEMYPEIIVANEKAYREKNAAPFYTNSTQLPVGHTDDIFEALTLQDELQSKYTGGTVVHCFLGEKISSVEATKALVRKIAENFKIPYFTLTPTFSICPKHGYLVGEHEYCPKCDEEIEYKEVK